MNIPWLALAGVSAGANLLSNILAPGKAKTTAGDIRGMLEATKRSGLQQIRTGVGEANVNAAAHAAQAGITSPGYLTRVTGMNEMRGGQMGAQLEADIARQQLGAQLQLDNINLQAGQRKAMSIGNVFGSIADPLASMATLEYLVNNPDILSKLSGPDLFKADDTGTGNTEVN